MVFNLHGDTSDCKLHNSYTLQLGILAGVSLVIGTFMCFWGYKFFKTILFLTGLLVGFVATYMLCDLYLSNHLKGKSYENRQQIYLGVGAAVGLITGLLTLCLFYLGLFVLGATMGWFVGLAFLPLITHHSAYVAQHVWVSYMILVAFAIFGGVVIFCLQKVWIIISTSFTGAFLLVNGLAYYIENSTTLYYSIDVLSGKVESAQLPRCWYTWVLFTFIPVLFIVGMGVQFGKTSRGEDHRAGYPGYPRGRNVLLVAYDPGDTPMEDFAGDQVPILPSSNA
ncbi:transmembrane protein 198-B [Nematostella vectensis]|uniref:transmembrane protein 198-B n=1 Tax=Nematostella vectensis TaxID=45351 RepID=UPI00138FB277|nr:transmembrane protein 198-B [Nematostella vectensis]